MWWSIQICFNLLLLVKLGQGATNDPVTSKSVGDDLAISLNTHTRYIKDGGRLEVKCILRNQDDKGGPPTLVFKNDADNVEIPNGFSGGRVNIAITKGESSTTGLFVWDPISVEDNEKIKTIHCQNGETRDGKQFTVRVIPEKSVPDVRIVNVDKKVKVNRGETRTFECRVNGTRAGDVEDFGAKWFIDDLTSRNKLPTNAKTENKLEQDPKTNVTTITSTLTIENVGVESFTTWYCVSQLQFAKGALEVVRKYFAKIEVENEESLSEVIKRKKGEDVTFNCQGSRSAPLSVKWYKVDEYSKEEVEIPGGIRYKSDKLEIRKVKEDKVNNSFLEIRDLTFKDRSQYRCNAQYKFRNVSITYTLRVSDPLGPLWPVVGIMVEAVVLFIVIWYSNMFAAGKKSKSTANKPLADGDEKQNSGPPPSKKKDPDTEDFPLMNSNEDGTLPSEVSA